MTVRCAILYHTSALGVMGFADMAGLPDVLVGAARDDRSLGMRVQKVSFPPPPPPPPLAAYHSGSV
jgi:hypothetical protein